MRWLAEPRKRSGRKRGLPDVSPFSPEGAGSRNAPRAEAGFQILTEVVHSSKPVDEALRSYARILIFPLLDKETLGLLRAIIGNAETLPEPAEAFWATGPTRVYQLVSEMIRSRMARGELQEADPVEAMHFFVASCTGRFWSQGLLAVQPKVTKAQVNAYVDQVIQAFLAVYAPRH